MVAALITSSVVGFAADETLGQRDTTGTATGVQRYQAVDTRTFEGRIVPLYSFLQKGEGRMEPGRTSSSRTGSSGRVGGDLTWDDRPRSATTHKTEREREIIEPSQPTLSATAPDQPLALISDSRSAAYHRPGLEGTGAPGRSARDRTPAQLGQEGVATPPAHAGTMGRSGRTYSAGQGEAYVLVFDPNDAQSRAAYQVAQTMSQPAAGMASERLRQPKDTAGATGDRAYVRESDQGASALAGTSVSGQQVKVTGRLLQQQGLQAIVVQKVERSTETSPSIRR